MFGFNLPQEGKGAETDVDEQEIASVSSKGTGSEEELEYMLHQLGMRSEITDKEHEEAVDKNDDENSTGDKGGVWGG